MGYARKVRRRAAIQRALAPVHHALAEIAARSTPDDPAAFQERHSPTEPVGPCRSEGGGGRQCRRRSVDVRLWGAMTAVQQTAAERIEETFTRLTAPGLSAVSTFEGPCAPARGRKAGGRAGFALRAPELSVERQRKYFRWAEACAAAGVSHAAALDVLVFGKSCLAVDRDRRQRHGHARQNLFAALDLYAHLRV